MNKSEMWNRMQAVWSAEAASVNRLKDIVNMDAVTFLVELIADCKHGNGRVITTGLGTSAVAANKIAHTLSCIEIPSFFLSPGDAAHGALGAVQREDVVIAISKGGGTRELLNILPGIKKKGAKLVGVSENEASELAMASDLLLKVKVEREPDPFNMLATASTMAVIAVFDAVAIVLMHHTNYQKAQFAVIHPGGAVGERLIKDEKQ